MQVAVGDYDGRGLGMNGTTRTRRVGPVYDDAMRALADDDLAAILALAGVSTRDGVRRHADLPAHTIHADLVARLPSGDVVHMEYVKDGTPDLDLRMVDYRIRLRRRDRSCPIRQFVLVLGDIDVPDHYLDVDLPQLLPPSVRGRLPDERPRSPPRPKSSLPFPTQTGAPG